MYLSVNEMTFPIGPSWPYLTHVPVLFLEGGVSYLPVGNLVVVVAVVDKVL